jgi:signal transduction histidine kinase
MKSPWWRIRNWSIRAKILTLLVPPLASLVAFWIFATSLMLGSALNLLAARTNYEEAAKPAQEMVTQLQYERRLSLTFLGGGRSDARALTDQRKLTDVAVANFRRHAGGTKMRDAETAATRQRVDDAFVALDSLVTGRQAVDFGQLDRAGAMRLYTTIVDRVYRIYTALPGVEQRGLSRDSRTVIQLSRAREALSQEDAYLNGIAAAGKVSAVDLAQFGRLVGAQRFLFADAVPELREPDREAYQRVLEGDAAGRLRAMEDKIIVDARPNAALPVDIALWRSTYEPVSDELRAAETAAAEAVVRRGAPFGVDIAVRLTVAALLGLLAVSVSILLSVRIGRSLVRRLTGLREAAQNMADERLPEVVARLRRGEELSGVAETGSLRYGADEIGDVADAFSAVQRTAVQSAVQEAQLRRGLNEVFLNIARRSQTLVHRQLSLLDRMERRSNDPEELEDLFRLDHLATRMRRHAEDLVILAGAAPGRGWRNPVPMMDVIRGAVSEVEDYARVRLLTIPDVSLVGRAVADVIHLLAEIVENATAYSPPHTPVQISGQVVPNGFAVEIEDRGLGMPSDAIEEANKRLRNPPDFDPTNSARLGLFVVSLLAARHGIRVTLRTSPYGGVTAVVLVPPDLIAGTAPDASVDASAAEYPAVLTLASTDAVRPVQPQAAGATHHQRPAIGPGTGGPDAGTTPAPPPAKVATVAVAPPEADAPASSGPWAATSSAVPAVSPSAGPSAPVDSAEPDLVAPTASAVPPTVPAREAAPGDGEATPGLGGAAGAVRAAGSVAAQSAPAGETPPVTPTGRARQTTASAPVETPASQQARPAVTDPEPAARPATVRSAAAVVEITDDGLPKRRRQASLAPQLRSDPAVEPPTKDVVPDVETRSPEQIRDMMTSFQTGLLRGRRDAAVAGDLGEPSRTGGRAGTGDRAASTDRAGDRAASTDRAGTGEPAMPGG